MNATKKLLLGAICVATMLAVQIASAITITGSKGSLEASATFTASGGNLIVVLDNTSTADVMVPTDVLTALFFDIVGNNGALTPLSAKLSGGSTVLFDSPPAGGVVGGEWAYGSGLSGAPLGAKEGISSSGFGLFGNYNFAGVDLDPPPAVDGLNYGLTSAGDNPATGNAAVTGKPDQKGNVFPLIQHQVTFTLSGLTLSQEELDNAVANVSFQYGTALGEPNITTPDAGSTVALLGLFFSGLSLAGWRVRRTKA